jgi:hypothetical protein
MRDLEILEQNQFKMTASGSCATNDFERTRTFDNIGK